MLKLLGIAVVLAAEIAPFSTSTPQTAIKYWADFYNVSYPALYYTLQCESGFNPRAIGDEGTSYGIAQFHKLQEWGITKADAYDPDFAIRFAALQFSLGKADHWSCFRSLPGTLQVPPTPPPPVLDGVFDKLPANIRV